MTQEYQAQGVVMRLQNIGDSHRLVELLTPERGRFVCLAPGARASRRRFAGVLDLFVALRFTAKQSKRRLGSGARGGYADGSGGRATGAPEQGSWTLAAAEGLTMRTSIRASLAALQRASVLTACARALTVEGQEAKAAFTALTWGLDTLAAGHVMQSATAYVGLLAASGLQPDGQRCCGCGSQWGLDTPGLVAAASDRIGLLCRRCLHVRHTPLSAQAVAVLAQRRVCADPAAASAVEKVVLGWVETQLQQRLPVRRAFRLGM